MIGTQKGMTYFRVVLNFHPKREDARRDLDLRAITRQTIRVLEERLHRRIDFFAVEHDNHGQNELRHVHAIVPIKLAKGERLTRDDFKAMRDIATGNALEQRKARDIVREYLRNREFLKRARTPPSFSSRTIGVFAGRARSSTTARAPTPPCQTYGLGHSTVRLPNGSYWCRECARVQEQSVELSL
jgi:hypothetical protein